MQRSRTLFDHVLADGNALRRCHDYGLEKRDVALNRRCLAKQQQGRQRGLKLWEVFLLGQVRLQEAGLGEELRSLRPRSRGLEMFLMLGDPPIDRGDGQVIYGDLRNGDSGAVVLRQVLRLAFLPNPDF